MSINVEFKKTEYPYRGGVLKDKLIKLRGHKCEDCGLTEWKNQPIPLEAHHIDGDKCNNTLENLLLLCPNCHTLTSNYGSKKQKHIEVSDEDLKNALLTHDTIRQALFSLNMSDAGANYEKVKVFLQNNPDIKLSKKEIFIKEKKVKTCPDCGKVILPSSIRCGECSAKAQRWVDRPDRETLKKEVYDTPFTQLGKKYGVSYKSIQKWCNYYNLPSRRQDINKYSKEKWMAL